MTSGPQMPLEFSCGNPYSETQLDSHTCWRAVRAHERDRAWIGSVPSSKLPFASRRFRLRSMGREFEEKRPRCTGGGAAGMRLRRDRASSAYGKVATRMAPLVPEIVMRTPLTGSCRL